MAEFIFSQPYVPPVPPSSGAVNIVASQSTSSTTYTTLATPDQVTGIVLPTNGKIIVDYQAMWQASATGGAAQAAIFLGSNQLVMQGWLNAGSKQPQPQATEIANQSGVNYPLFTYSGGLASINGGAGGGYSADVTTGQIVGGGISDAGGDGILAEMGTQATAFAPGGVWGGACHIFAAAGTYTVSVRFKTSSGTVTASNRKLWVEVKSYG